MPATRAFVGLPRIFAPPVGDFRINLSWLADAENRGVAG